MDDRRIICRVAISFRGVIFSHATKGTIRTAGTEIGSTNGKEWQMTFWAVYVIILLLAIVVIAVSITKIAFRKGK